MQHQERGRFCKFAVIGFCLLAAIVARGGLVPANYVVPLTAQAQLSPPQITLTWAADPDARSFTIYRKLSTDTSWGTAVATLTNTATSFTDTNVAVGSAFEYQIVDPKDYFPYPNGTSAQWTTAYGYIYAGVQVPLVENRGKVILVVDNTFSVALTNELAQLQQDLAGDGWQVLRHDVGRSNTVTSVKALIQTDYNADPANTRAVFLFGHVPVPYSGDLQADQHDDHMGAWPADVYYGEMSSSWTDGIVNDNSAQDSRNHNVPGDGKFDQSSVPSAMELQVGRVDLSNLPSFAPKTEQDLLRQYLNKDHQFRFKITNTLRRGLLLDNFGDQGGPAAASSGWLNFAPFFGLTGTTSIDTNQFFPTLNSQSYLWSYACGPGTYQSSLGVGATTDFAATDTQSVFYMLFGSYYGDWDTTDDFLRAPLATTTYGLTCAWAGYPHWYFQHMALGLNIGYSAVVTQNNGPSGLYQNQVNTSAGLVHIALMGDPTLRMHVVGPPSNLKNLSSNAVSLSWTASTDTVAGYHVYRATNSAGPYARLTPALLTTTAFNDTSVPAGIYTYMVRAVKLETTGSGTYYNPSQGIFQAVNLTSNVVPAGCFAGPLGLVGWWPGDGNANDIQGTNNGRLVNGTTFATGEVGMAFNFNGVTNQVNVGGIFPSLTNTFTMVLWARPTAALTATAQATTGVTGLTGQRYAIFPRHGTSSYGTNHTGAGISIGTNGVSVFEHADNLLASPLVYSGSITGWAYIAVVYQNGQPQLYINGILKQTGLKSPYNVHPSADMGGPYGFYSGAADEVGVYNRALSAAEIQSIYNAGSAGMCKIINVIQVGELPGGLCQITCQGKTGSFGIDVTTNLVNWTPLVTLTNSGTTLFIDSLSPNYTSRFYRTAIR